MCMRRDVKRARADESRHEGGRATFRRSPLINDAVVLTTRPKRHAAPYLAQTNQNDTAIARANPIIKLRRKPPPNSSIFYPVVTPPTGIMIAVAGADKPPRATGRGPGTLARPT